MIQIRKNFCISKIKLSIICALFFIFPAQAKVNLNQSNEINSVNLNSLNALNSTPDLLDKAWENRATNEGQTQILEFIEKYSTLPEDFEITWRISRLVYFIGNFGLGEKISKSEQKKIFEYGTKAGAIAKRLGPNRVEGYYWYAINLGMYSLAEGLMTALKSAPASREALLEAAKIDPTYQWAGPYRILGRYYQDLPSIISFGDKVKAEDYFKKAIEIAPNYRLNTVYLAVLKKDPNIKLKLFEEAEKKPDMDGVVEEERYKRNIKKDIEDVKE